MSLRTLAAQVEQDHQAYADGLRTAAPVVDALAAEWPSIREEIHAEVAAAVWALSPEAWSRAATVKNAARTAIGETVDRLGRPVSIPGRSYRRARGVAEFVEDHGMTVEEAAAEVGGIDVGTLFALRKAADSGYLPPATLTYSQGTSPVWPAKTPDAGRSRHLEWLDTAASALPPSDRAILRGVLRGLSLRKIARREGIGVGTVHRRLERIIARLAERLGAVEETYHQGGTPAP